MNVETTLSAMMKNEGKYEGDLTLNLTLTLTLTLNPNPNPNAKP